MVYLVGVGNLNTDIVVHVDYSLLEKVGLRKGDDAGKKEYCQLKNLLKDRDKQYLPGGSVANTIVGAHDLGLACALGGIIGNDQLGREYLKNIKKAGLKHKIIQKEGESANVFCLITPDKERTFADNLGVANSYEKEDLPYDFIEPECIFYTSNYALEGRGRPVILDLINHAKQTGTKIGFDLGSARLVESDRKFLIELLDDKIDIVFCNDFEAEKLAQMNTYDSLDFLGELCEIAVVTVGERGALIKNRNKTYKIPNYPAKVVDKTGAGDAFRAGFFYGFFKTSDLEKSGKMGCYYSSKVISCIGARLNERIEDLENRI